MFCERDRFGHESEDAGDPEEVAWLQGDEVPPARERPHHGQP